MAQKPDPKGWVEGLGDDENSAWSEQKDFRDLVRKVLQQQNAVQREDDQGPIVTLPKMSKKWSTLIDDTIASVRRRQGSVTPDQEERRRRARSVPAMLGADTLETDFPSVDLSLPPHSARVPPPSYVDAITPLRTEAQGLSLDIESPSSSDSDTPPSLPPYRASDLPPEDSPRFQSSPDTSLTDSPELLRRSAEMYEMAPIGTRRIRKRSYKEEDSDDDRPIPLGYRDTSNISRGYPEHRAPGFPAPLAKFDEIEMSHIPMSYGAEKSLPPELPEVAVDQPIDDVETGWRPSDRYMCTSMGRLNPLGTHVGRFCLRRKDGVRYASPGRVAILLGAVIGILGLIVFLGVFPASFVYVEHYEIALLKNSVTGVVYRDETYHPGCYILGPDKEFVRFPGSAVFVSVTTEIFTKEKAIITITFHFQYFIKPAELGLLHLKYDTGYKSVIEIVVKARVKNLAPRYSIEEFRLNRTRLERDFYRIVRSRLEGTCCPTCCPTCSNVTVCSVCDPSDTCDPSYYVEVRYFQMSTVAISSFVTERYLQSLLLQVEAETEFLLQNHTVIGKMTERLVQQRKNKARELVGAGEATAAATQSLSYAKREANITTAYVTALKGMYARLGVTNNDHKLSLMMMRALEDVKVKGQLFRGYNFGNNTILGPSIGSG